MLPTAYTPRAGGDLPELEASTDNQYLHPARGGRPPVSRNSVRPHGCGHANRRNSRAGIQMEPTRMMSATVGVMRHVSAGVGIAG